MKILLTALVLFGFASTAMAQDPAPQPSPENGLEFKSTDGRFTAKLNGWVIEHYRNTFQLSDNGGRGSVDSFYAREIAVAFSGTMAKDFEYKIESNFASGAANTAGVLDAWAAWKKYPACSLKFGNAKEPFSQEETTSLRFIDFVEKSDLNRLAVGRDLGVMLYGRLADGLLSYELGYYNGQGSNLNDLNDEKDTVLRIRFSPFAGDPDGSMLKGLRIGAAITRGYIEKGAITGESLSSTQLQTAFFVASGATNFIDGIRQRVGLELSYLWNQLGFRAEVAKRTDEVDTATNEDEKIDSTAYYVALTYLVTGDKKTLENRIAPAKDFDSETGDWGAIEVALRVDGLRIDRSVFTLGIGASAGNANSVQATTLGVNWWLTKNFRVSPNLVMERYGDKLAFGLDTKDSATGILLRFQLDF